MSPETNTSNRFSRIDLGECEDLLRQEYNLNENVSLLVLLSEKQTNKATEKDTQFEIYESDGKKKLNLSICNEIPIDIYTPLILSEEIQNLHNELKNLGYDFFINKIHIIQHLVLCQI